MEANYIVAVLLRGGPCKGSTVYVGCDGLLIYNPLAAVRYTLAEAEAIAGKMYSAYVIDWAVGG